MARPQKNDTQNPSTSAGSAALSDPGKPSTIAQRDPKDRAAFWSKYFDDDRDPDTVRDLVSELIDNRKYDEVINCIEQAILHGQIQPWMHQVLALAMQAAKRPKAQIERVLLSSQDLIANDVNSMMQLAAYLVRFDRLDQAIELYRQAAAIEPARPEPYVLALELAVRVKHYQTIAWAAPEVLSYSWSKGRERLNKLAEQAAAEAIPALMKNGNFPMAIELQTAMRKARQIDLVVRLEWSGQGDLDIQINEPGGTQCSVVNQMTQAGGVFVHDGYGPNQGNCYEEYLCPQALHGEYRVIVRHNSGDIVGKRSRLTLIRDRGTPSEESVTETIFLGPKDQTIRFFISRGRREKASVVKVTPAPDANQTRPTGIYSQLGAGGGIAQFAQRNSAVGYTPVITNIPEGVRMSAMATVSGDRRYVRINANPIFSTITDVFTFTPVK